MKDLIKMFPDATKHTRRPVIEDKPNDRAFGKSVAHDAWMIFLGSLAFAVAAVVILVLMGALKLLGVKSLD